jgi:arginase
MNDELVPESGVVVEGQLSAEPLVDATRRRVRIIGVASGSGARDHGCQDGPDELRSLGIFRGLQEADDRLCWDQTINSPGPATGPLDAVAQISEVLANAVRGILTEGNFPLVVGGDHSCAIGTWSGAHAHVATTGRLGLLWIDAHMDSHTFRTSPSKAIHGMPLACLLGFGHYRLTRVMSDSPKILPRDLCLIGVRSFESGEAALLRRLGVRVYFMKDVKKRGLKEVFREAVAYVSEETVGYGISLDIDALDPVEEPGVGSPVPDGILESDLSSALKSIHADKKLLALEVVEYNPHHDRNNATAEAVRNLCGSILI